MQIPQLRMQSTQAILGIEKSNSSIQIQQPQAQMELHQPKGEIEMKRIPPKLTIDQTEAWADMNLKSAIRRNKEAAGEGYQAWMQYLAKTAQEGSELMKIENGGGAIAAQAKRNGQLPKHELGLGFIPSPFSVKFNYQPGDVQITPHTYDVVSNIKAQKPIIHYQPGSVNYHLQQKNSLQFDILA
jgi:Family of unknown function (DUF6470)